MQRLPEAILKSSGRLFGDVDLSSLDPQRHEDFIFGRVLSEGSEEAVRALRAEVGDSALRAFLARAPHRLDRRTRRFLEVVLANTVIEEQTPCTKTPFRRDSAVLFWR